MTYYKFPFSSGPEQETSMKTEYDIANQKLVFDVDKGRPELAQAIVDRLEELGVQAGYTGVSTGHDGNRNITVNRNRHPGAYHVGALSVDAFIQKGHRLTTLDELYDLESWCPKKTPSLPDKLSSLPDKLSALIMLALDDLVKVENTPGFTIKMGEWYCPDIEGGTCEVCFAGAVIAQELGYDNGRILDPCAVFGSDIGHKMMALDLIRMGNIQSALRTMGELNIPPMPPVFVTSYDKDPAQFKWQMRVLTHWLERQGW